MKFFDTIKHGFLASIYLCNIANIYLEDVWCQDVEWQMNGTGAI